MIARVSCFGGVFSQLVLHKLRRRKPCDFLEKACEVMGIVEAEQSGRLADVATVHQQAFALVDDIGVDVADGGAASSLVNHIAEIAWRIGQLRGTPCHSGKSIGELAAIEIVLFKQCMEAFQQVG